MSAEISIWYNLVISLPCVYHVHSDLFVVLTLPTTNDDTDSKNSLASGIIPSFPNVSLQKTFLLALPIFFFFNKLLAEGIMADL